MYCINRDNLKKAYNNNAHIREKNEMQDWKVKPREVFLQIIKKEGKSTILDIGAGHGRDSKFFKDSNLQVTAVDLSDEMVRLCRDKGIEAYELDFHELHRIDKSFDAVWAMNSLLHVEKNYLPQVLQGIKDKLKPSGLFFMGVYGGEDKEGIWEEDFYSPQRFFSFYTDDSIKRIVSEFFVLVSFERIETGSKYYFQSIVLRKE
ncbi:MAG: class I SAM-dependent methyltransferase [Bacillota bacterium]